MNKELKDMEIVCLDCKIKFVWTKGEQKFLHELCEEGKLDKEYEGRKIVGRVKTPIRCEDCRIVHRYEVTKMLAERAEKEAQEANK